MKTHVAACAALMMGVETLAPATLLAWMHTLSRSQQQRAARFRSTRRSRQFVAARYLLQTLLREDAGVDAEVVANENGVPGIAGGGLYCSIAHSSDSVMVAYSRQGPVGVDVEHTRQRDWMRLVQAWFSEADREYARRLSGDQGRRWFYRQWTAREAIAKAEGSGQLLASLRCPMSALGSWRMTELELPGYQGAIAHAGSRWLPIRVAEWDGMDRALRLVPLSHTRLDYRMKGYENQSAALISA